MGLQKLEFVFDLGAASAEQICSAILGVMSREGELPPVAKLYEGDVPTETLVKKVKQLKKQAFQIDIGTLAFHFVSVRAYSHDLLEIRERAPRRSVSWDEWVSAFAVNYSLVQAWVSDIEYVRWQNAEDPLEYKAAGKSTAGLPMKSNGLPPPLEQMIVDTSRNPSRRVVRKGYVEAIGGTMWLMPSFFERVGRDIRQRLESAEWVNISSARGGLLRLQIGNGLFEDSSTEGAQRELRGILFS